MTCKERQVPLLAEAHAAEEVARVESKRVECSVDGEEGLYQHLATASIRRYRQRKQ